VSIVDSTFVRSLDVGVWYVFVYNDNDKPLEFAFTASQQGMESSIAASCSVMLAIRKSTMIA
jgi:hypothetical protein